MSNSRATTIPICITDYPTDLTIIMTMITIMMLKKNTKPRLLLKSLKKKLIIKKTIEDLKRKIG